MGPCTRRQAFKLGAIAEDRLEAAASAVATAAAGHALARSQVKAAEAALAVATADPAPLTSRQGIEAQDARIRRAAAAVALAELHLAGSQVKAPVAGRLARRLVASGERVLAGQALATLVEAGRRWVEAPVPQADWPRVAVGQPATVTIDAWPGKAFEGRVVDLGALAGPQAAGLAPGAPPDPLLPPAVPVRVELTAPAPDLVPGMAASVLIGR